MEGAKRCVVVNCVGVGKERQYLFSSLTDFFEQKVEATDTDFFRLRGANDCDRDR